MAINKFIGIGNLGRDPEFRATAEGTSVANISIAITEKYKDKQGNQKENTEWVNVVFFGKLADIAAQYLKKGSQVYIEGKLKTDKYEKNGETKYSTKVVAEKLQMLGNMDRKSKQSKDDDEEAHQHNRRDAEQDSFDDDIPF